MTALGLATVLLLAEGRYPESFRMIREQGQLVLQPLQAAVTYPGQLLSWFQDQARTTAGLRREIAALRAEQQLTAVRLQRLAELSAENARLRGLLDSGLVTTGRMLLAEVIRADPNPDRLVLTIDKGGMDGLQVGQPVLDAGGIMGQVIEIHEKTAEIMLISDRRHGVAVSNARSGTRGILRGTGENARLELDYVPESADIQKGDELLSSGLGARYPAGYPVATVTEVFRSGGGEFAAVQARPVAALGRSRHVVVLFPSPFAPDMAAAPPDSLDRQELPDATP